MDLASVNFLRGWTPLQLNAKHSRVKKEEAE